MEGAQTFLLLFVGEEALVKKRLVEVIKHF